MVTSQNGLVDSCCFDYGNAETDSRDDGNGTMEAVYFGGGVVWGTGTPGGHNNGPWVMADLENGLYAGWENNQDQNISTNTPIKLPFITAVLVGDACTGVAGCGTSPTAKAGGRFALYGGDATTGALKTHVRRHSPAEGRLRADEEAGVDHSRHRWRQQRQRRRTMVRRRDGNRRRDNPDGQRPAGQHRRRAIREIGTTIGSARTATAVGGATLRRRRCAQRSVDAERSIDLLSRACAALLVKSRAVY